MCRPLKGYELNSGCQRRHCKAYGLPRSVHVRFKLYNCKLLLKSPFGERLLMYVCMYVCINSLLFTFLDFYITCYMFLHNFTTTLYIYLFTDHPVRCTSLVEEGYSILAETSY